MRILLVTDGYPPIPGGLEAHVERLARFLHRSGHEVSVVTAGGGATDKWQVVTSSTLLAHVPQAHQRTTGSLPPPWPDPLLMRSIEHVVLKLKPEVIHAHGWSSASAAVVARRHNVPMVETLHDYGKLCPMRTLLNDGHMCDHTAGLRCRKCPGSNQSTAKRLFLAAGIVAARRKTNQTVYKFLAVSNAVARIHRNAGLSGEIEVIPNFIDTPDRPFAPPPKGGAVLYVGPWTAEKGSVTTSNAHRLLMDRGREIVLHQVGDPAGPDGVLIHRSGRLVGPELDAAFDEARLVVVPSTWSEPCPTVALEAMAAGRVVVASAVGGLTDIVQDEVTGKLVPPNDAKALADAIEDLFDDDHRLEVMGLAGLEAVKSFSTSSVGPKIEAAYVSAAKSVYSSGK